MDLVYTYDNSSNITQLVNGWRDTNSNWHSQTESYSYDGVNRLTSASCASWSHTYAYDKVGNRTGKDGVTYTVNAVNEVTTLSDSTSFIYDDNGNRTQKTKGTDTWDYTYDYANRLKKVEKNDTIIGEYVYDGDGTRIQATEDSVTTTSIYSWLDILYEETMTGNAVYIYGPTGRIAKRTTINQETNIFYYHTDHLGSTRLVTDSNKNVVSAAAYQPFGEPDTQEGSEDFLFTGKEKDATGLYYYGARYYDSDLGRFITRDPLKGRAIDPQSLNRYTYCHNNPLKYIDPWGEKDALHDIPYDGSSESDESENSSGIDPNADYWNPDEVQEMVDEMTEEQSQDPPGNKSEEERIAELLAMLALAEGWIDTKPAGGTFSNLKDQSTEALKSELEESQQDGGRLDEGLDILVSLIGALGGAALLVTGLGIATKGTLFMAAGLGGLFAVAFLGAPASAAVFAATLVIGALTFATGAGLIVVGSYLLYRSYKRYKNKVR